MRKFLSAILILYVLLLLGCYNGQKISLPGGLTYERTSEEELHQNHLNPQRMIDKLEQERQTEIADNIRKNNEESTKLSREGYIWKPWEQSPPLTPKAQTNIVEEGSPKNGLLKTNKKDEAK
jgi:hypothetical protein